VKVKTSSSIVRDIVEDRERGAARLIAEYRDRLYRDAFALCGEKSAAEDLVFKTFEQVLDKIEDCRDEQSFYAWMYAILRNFHLKSVRGCMVRNTVTVGAASDLESLDGTMMDGESVTVPIDGNIIRAAVEDLPPKMREVVVLHYFMDQPVAKIAKILSVSSGTIMSRLYYARLALGQKLKKSKRVISTVLAAAVILVSSVWAAGKILEVINGSSGDVMAGVELDGNASYAGDADNFSAESLTEQAGQTILQIQQKDKTMRTATAKSKLMGGVLAVASLATAPAVGGVYDDCAWWFRGGRDADSSGTLATGEFYDEIHASDPAAAAHANAAVTGTLTYRNEPVRRACDALSATNTVPVVYIPQNGSTATAYVSTSSLMNNVLDGHFDAYTLLFRVRRERNTTANAVQTFALVGYSSYYNIGGLLRFVGDDDSADGKHIVYYINKTYWSQHYNTLKIPTNEWVDIAVLVSGAKVRIGVAQPTASSSAKGIVFEEKTFSTDVMPQKGKGDWALFAEGATSDKFFSGSCQQVAVWPRALSDAEVVEAFGFPRPSVWQVGLENGGSTEFSSTHVASQTIDVQKPWHDVSPVLNAGESRTVAFPLRAEEVDSGAQVLLIKPLSGSATLSVTINGQSVGSKSVQAGLTQYWFIPKAKLRRDTNELEISRIDSGNASLEIDMMQMSGSWQLGGYGNAWGDFANEGYVTPNLETMADMNPQHFPRVVGPAESSIVKSSQKIRVWVSKAVADRCQTLFRIDSWIGGANLPVGGDGWVKLYVNGAEKMTLHQGDVAATTWTAGQDQVEFNPGELQAGWNEFELRGSSVNSSAYYLFDYIRFSVLKESRGFMLIVK
jgi:RNA polymerase sigma-70 factor (ECF subfamily)